MAEIVAALLTSHAPLITGKPEVSKPEQRDRLYGGFHELRRRLAAARPDLIVMFVNDHIQNFPYSNMPALDRKSTRLNSSHLVISYAVFCLKKKKKNNTHNLFL